MAKASKKIKVQNKNHPWRLCPLGKFFRRPHPQKAYVRKDGTQVRGSEHPPECVVNRSGKDQIYDVELTEIAKRYFKNLNGPPTANSLDYSDGNNFDSLIRGWTKYWNDILQSGIPLDPNLVKALIATESGFNPDPKRFRGSTARGLMQITNATRKLLAGDGPDLKDHFVHVDEEDITDPNLNIALGIRWLFRKKEIVSSRDANSTWVDAVAAYKDYKSVDDPQMQKLIKLYKRLTQ